MTSATYPDSAEIGEVLRIDALWAAAVQQSGLEDFGDEGFVEPMGRLIEALRTEARLTAAGLEALRAQFVGALVTRLRLRDVIARHPRIRQERIRGPLLITGLPRTGTTKLQRVLGANPDLQSLPLWKILDPVPPVEPVDPDPRIAAAEAHVAGIKAAFPEFFAGHPMVATEPDEEDFLLEQSFRSSVAYTSARIPSYQAWILDQNVESTYHWLRMILQVVQWGDGSREDRTWLLKGPSHLARLDEVFTVFPGTVIVHCHRDPVRVIPSICAVVEGLRRFYTDRIDRDEVGRFAVDLYAGYMARYLRDRDRWAASGKRFLDVGFADIVDDIEATAGQVCRFAGVPYSAAASAATRGWDRDNPPHKHGKHHYSLEQYGLRAEEIQAAFADYLETFAAIRDRT